MSINRKRLIIIEDNTPVMEDFRDILNMTDRYEVVNAYDNCEKAIRKLAVDKPDIVLMDIELPGMDGIEGTRKIRQQLPDCIVLIITVYEESEKVFNSLCAGAVGYIVKNTDMENLVATIDEAVSGGAPMSLSIARMVVQSFRKQEDSPLSARELQVLKGISEGKTHTRIAEELFISRETVKSHIKNIYTKLEVCSKAEALKIANRQRWL